MVSISHIIMDLIYSVGLVIGILYLNYWQCGDNTYEMLPRDWSGCGFLAKLNINNAIVRRGSRPILSRQNRDMASVSFLRLIPLENISRKKNGELDFYPGMELRSSQTILTL